VTISRFHVAAMDCASEEQLVRMALSDVDGINGIEFTLGQRDVVIDHDVDAGTILAALEILKLGAQHVDDISEIGPITDTRRERNALLIALVINAGFFVGELTVGVISRSMGVIADALDMGADASVYALSLAAVGTAASRKRQLARASGSLQFGLATIGLIAVVRRFFTDNELPDPASMIVISMLALAGNIVTLIVLHRVRSGEAHLQASWIFTANDIKVNVLVITAAIGVGLTDSAVPDLLAGGIIFVVVANGARRILAISRAPTDDSTKLMLDEK
jgi:Co/Zn/Cd efflux system component